MACRGYAEYDVVAQFDCDHIPGPTYLSSCLPAFLDRSIGYVACPSVNTLVCKTSWAARGRLHYESVFNGAGQAAWFPDYMPVCIGSHYVVRTAHLKMVSPFCPFTSVRTEVTAQTHVFADVSSKKVHDYSCIQHHTE